MLFVEITYLFCTLLLAIYGLNSLYLIWRFWRTRKRDVPRPPDPDIWPTVTVQLPIYNELYVIERLLGAVTALDYPKDRLQIQILDDSTDETATVVRRAVAQYRARGYDISCIHRHVRRGYKAGALADGLRLARGELIAIFDADFVPSRDFLCQTVPYFAMPDLGCVQTRWEHVNGDYSTFTRAQAMGIDAHFFVEQAARSQSDLFMNFNGSGGVWRRECIVSAGGWQGDVLTEDLDLSYRAQLQGWRILFLSYVSVPGELPPQMDALRRQQFRWAKGSIQTARKLLLPLLCSRQPLRIRLEGAIHLTNYLVHPIVLVMLLLMLPLSLSPNHLSGLLPYSLLPALGPPLLVAVAAMQRGKPYRYWPLSMLLLLLIGTGLSLSNAIAVAEAVLGRGSEFQRTPKFNVRSLHDRWERSIYSLPHDWKPWCELALSALALMLMLFVSVQQKHIPSPWLAVYTLGYGYVGLLSLSQSWRQRRAPKIRPALAGRM
ncbi:MAG: glycosyltransferase [Chloroflexi bacterium]|nr:glycosyltransferase [Chloroflexota bacterium]